MNKDGLEFIFKTYPTDWTWAVGALAWFCKICSLLVWRSPTNPLISLAAWIIVFWFWRTASTSCLLIESIIWGAVPGGDPGGTKKIFLNVIAVNLIE